jgi:hypothetical protein
MNRRAMKRAMQHTNKFEFKMDHRATKRATQRMNLTKFKTEFKCYVRKGCTRGNRTTRMGQGPRQGQATSG